MNDTIYRKILSKTVMVFIIGIIILAFYEDVTRSMSSVVYIFFLCFFLNRIVSLFIEGKSYYGLGRQLVEFRTDGRINYLSIGLLLVTYTPICVVIMLWLVGYVR